MQHGRRIYEIGGKIVCLEWTFIVICGVGKEGFCKCRNTGNTHIYLMIERHLVLRLF